MIPVLSLHIIDEIPIDLGMHWSTAAEYNKPRNISFLRDQWCKVKSGQVSICREIQVNRTYWKFSDPYAFVAVATNLVRNFARASGAQGVISKWRILAEW